MKLKNSFLGSLLPSRDDNPHDKTERGQQIDRRNYYLYGLLLLWFIVYLLICKRLDAQSTKPLHVGDKVPDITIYSMINYTSRTAKMSDFKGKVLILDFWSTWCGGCINFLPRADSLNRELHGTAIILPVTDQSEATVRKFLSANDFLKGYQIVSVVGDRLLKSLFPYQLLPQEVWINPSGNIAAITFPDYVTAENIKLVASGKLPKWPVKEDKAELQLDKPLLLSSTYCNDSSLPILHATVVTGHLNGYDLIQHVALDSLRSTKRITYVNERLLSLYAQSLNSGLPYTPAMRIFKTGHPRDFDFFPDSDYYDNWERTHTYTFETVVQLNMPKQDALLDILRIIEKQLGIRGRIEPVDTECWILSRTDSTRLASHYSKHNYVATTRPLQMHHWSTADLVYTLNLQENAAPVVDGVGSKQRFDLDVAAWPVSLDEWNKVLRPFGLRFIKQRRRIDMFVLEKNAKSLSSLPINRP